VSRVKGRGAPPLRSACRPLWPGDHSEASRLPAVRCSQSCTPCCRWAAQQPLPGNAPTPRVCRKGRTGSDFIPPDGCRGWQTRRQHGKAVRRNYL